LRLISNGLNVVAGPPNSLTETMIDQYGEHSVEMTKPDENGMQCEQVITSLV
jgi:hypothetical protein